MFLGSCGTLPDIDQIMAPSKQAPDEAQVKVHQMLVVPPDYQLRPPPDGSNVESANNPYALPALTPGAPAPTVTQPGQPTQVATSDPNAPGPQSITPGANPPATTNAQYGVTTVNPDGTPKSRQEINAEVRKRHLEEKRKKNPSYGTIWNIGELFSDW